MQQLAISYLNGLHTMWDTKAGFVKEQLAAEKYFAAWLKSGWEDIVNLRLMIEDQDGKCFHSDTNHTKDYLHVTYMKSADSLLTHMEAADSLVTVKNPE